MYQFHFDWNNRLIVSFNNGLPGFKLWTIGTYTLGM